MDKLQCQGIKSKGYGIIYKSIMLDRSLTIEAKAIYSYFCSYAGAGDTAFPSVSKIVYDLNISEDRYRKHFNLLKKYDYIRVQQIKDNSKFRARKFRVRKIRVLIITILKLTILILTIPKMAILYLIIFAKNTKKQH